jgi:hypothetical protein
LPTSAKVVAGVLIVAYLTGLTVQWITANDIQDVAWARREGLFVGLEALVFAAVGAVLGVQVQRRATGAEVRAEREQSTAELGRTAAKLERSRARGAVKVGGPLERAKMLAEDGDPDALPRINEQLEQLETALEEAGEDFDERVEETMDVGSPRGGVEPRHERD